MLHLYRITQRPICTTNRPELLGSQTQVALNSFTRNTTGCGESVIKCAPNLRNIHFCIHFHGYPDQIRLFTLLLRKTVLEAAKNGFVAARNVGQLMN